MRTILKDLRYAARIFSKRPALTAVLVLTLALGIGANSAIFSVVDAVLFQPLPYHQPDRLVRIYEHNQARGFNRISTSFHNFTDWRAQTQVFETMAAYQMQAANLTGGNEPRHVISTICSPALFQVFQAGSALGRTLLADDDLPGKDGVVVLGHRFWQEYFGGDPVVIGTTVRVNGVSCTIVGVMPAYFTFPDAAVDLWRPMLRDPNQQSGDRARHFASVVGRRRWGLPWKGRRRS